MSQGWGAEAFNTGHVALIKAFRCATTGNTWDDEVERWIRSAAIPWVADESRADMDRRLLLLFDGLGNLAGIAAHELRDAIAAGVESGFVVRHLTAIAVGVDWQATSIPRSGRVSDVLMSTTLSDINSRPQSVGFVNAFIHEGNPRSRALFARNGFVAYPPAIQGYLRNALTM